MQKEGWISKRFDEVFDLQMGRTPSRDNKLYWTDGQFKWISIADLKNQKYITSTKECITELAVTESGIKPIPINTVIMSFKLSIGKTAITKESIFSNEAIMAFHLKSGYEIIPEYFYHYLNSYDWGTMNRAVMGQTLNKATISAKKIIIPPLPTQHQIVCELDTLSDIISKKKQQIVELDKLAQATFYDMFGDPVSNEKGWVKGKIIDFAECIVPSRNKPKSFTGDIPWITTKDLVHLGKTNRDYYFLSEAEIKEVQAKKIPAGSILMTCVGDLGVVSIAENTMVINQQLHSFQCNKELNNIFAMFVISFYKEYMYKIATSTTVPYLNKKACNSVPMLLTPLTLQTQFASKIESIENQKVLINQSIGDVQQLFDYTMDKYFN